MGPKVCGVASVFVIFGFVMQLSEPGLPEASSLVSTSLNSIQSFTRKGNIDTIYETSFRKTSPYDVQSCYTSVCKGHWDIGECHSGEKSATAICQLEIWDWDNSNCPLSP